MSSCEKCWREAGKRSFGSVDQSEMYHQILAEKKRTGEVCTPEERAGEYAETCPKCNRKTIHQHTGDCMVCGRDISNSEVTQGLKEMLDEME